MRRIYSSLLILAIVFLSTTQSFAAPVIVKTMALSPEITTSGYVRVVVKLTDKYVNWDIGITIHEEEAGTSWNQGMGIAGFFFAEGVPQIRGYQGATPGWDLDNIKNFAIGDEIALWFSINAETDYHGLSAQTSTEADVTTVYSDFTSRAYAKSELSDAAKYCTIFFNDKNGDNTEGCIEIVKDAEIVSSIEPYFTPVNTLATQIESSPVKMYPTLVQNNLTIKSSADAINTVEVYSLTGQKVIAFENQNIVSLETLSAGTYIVSVTMVDGQKHMQKIIKN